MFIRNVIQQNLKNHMFLESPAKSASQALKGLKEQLQLQHNQLQRQRQQQFQQEEKQGFNYYGRDQKVILSCLRTNFISLS